jgi:transposase
MEELLLAIQNAKKILSRVQDKVALEAIKGEQTMSELGSRYELHPNMITNWKRQAIENIAIHLILAANLS